ncbi:MAG TPA: hypothetical protein DEF45_04545 [Rhodopirellula sp.]|nr:hypothetical protein [Rhodopirellula sp.]
MGKMLTLISINLVFSTSRSIILFGKHLAFESISPSSGSQLGVHKGIVFEDSLVDLIQFSTFAGIESVSGHGFNGGTRAERVMPCGTLQPLRISNCIE